MILPLINFYFNKWNFTLSLNDKNGPPPVRLYYDTHIRMCLHPFVSVFAFFHELPGGIRFCLSCHTQENNVSVIKAAGANGGISFYADSIHHWTGRWIPQTHKCGARPPRSTHAQVQTCGFHWNRLNWLIRVCFYFTFCVCWIRICHLEFIFTIKGL